MSLRNVKMGPYLENVKSTVKIWSIFVAFLENMNFNYWNFFLLNIFFTYIK